MIKCRAIAPVNLTVLSAGVSSVLCLRLPGQISCHPELGVEVFPSLFAALIHSCTYFLYSPPRSTHEGPEAPLGHTSYLHSGRVLRPPVLRSWTLPGANRVAGTPHLPTVEGARPLLSTTRQAY